MADKFTFILERAAEKGIVPNATVDAREWFREEAASIKVTQSEILAMRSRVSEVTIGSMYFFRYDPKNAKTLPYYDQYPLIFPFERNSTGFKGINFHYLSLKNRALLMDALYKAQSNNGKLRLSYDIIKTLSKKDLYKPCVKHYLNNNVRSDLIFIDPEYWDIALFLPLQNFAKASSSRVHTDSIKKVL